MLLPFCSHLLDHHEKLLLFMDAELRVDAAIVRAHRVLGDEERFGDGRAGVSACDEFGDFRFARGKPVFLGKFSAPLRCCIER